MRTIDLIGQLRAVSFPLPFAPLAAPASQAMSFICVRLGLMGTNCFTSEYLSKPLATSVCWTSYSSYLEPNLRLIVLRLARPLACSHARCRPKFLARNSGVPRLHTYRVRENRFSQVETPNNPFVIALTMAGTTTPAGLSVLNSCYVNRLASCCCAHRPSNTRFGRASRSSRCCSAARRTLA